MKQMEAGRWKTFCYRGIYVKNYIRYFFRKVRIPYFEVWVGQKCNLRCKNCCHLIPRIEQRCYDMEDLIGDCRRILTWCRVDFISIVGGEPFCNPQLGQLLGFLADCGQIRAGKIVTNGTILPGEETLQMLIRLKGKLEVRIDQYPGTERRVEKFRRRMEENGIPYHLNSFNPEKESSWKALNPPDGRAYSIAETRKRFAGCQIRTCSTLADGEFTACPRGIASRQVYSVEKNPYEHVRVRGRESSARAKARIATAMCTHVYKDYCRYCRSLSGGNPLHVIPGEQMERTEGEKGGELQ